jgi:hypothetical protein
MTIYKDQFEAVYQLIEKPERWTKGWFARTEAGEKVAPRDPRAVCWCVEGALCKILNLPTITTAGVDARNELECAYDLDATYNDNRTHADVLALLKRAIERAPVRPSSPSDQR